jgi:hypothetical protein
MVLGDQGTDTAFAADTQNVLAFHISNGSTIYTTPSYGIFAAISGDAIDVSTSAGLTSLDKTGSSTSLTSISGLGGGLTPWALGNWVGTINGLFSMFSAIPNNLTLSDYVVPQGNRQNQNATPKLQFADFIPGLTCTNNTRCNSAEATGADIVLNGGSKTLVNHLVYADNGSHPATIVNFLKESATPRDGIAFIGHSLVLQTPTCGTANYSVGLSFADGILIRTPNQFFDQNNPCYNYSFPPPQPFAITYANLIKTNAKVIFIGACDDINGVLGSLWDINSQTQGQALVMPDLSTVPQNMPGAVDLWQATLEWEQIASNLAAGKTLQQAVAAANQFLQSIASTLASPPEAWLIIGDPSVRLKPQL